MTEETFLQYEILLNIYGKQNRFQHERILSKVKSKREEIETTAVYELKMLTLSKN